MTFRTCEYEKEVRRALKDGHWPAGCAPELRNHVQQCAACNDLVLVTEAFQLARNQSVHETSIPADLLWWRAQLQRQRIVAEQVSRTVTVAQMFAWGVSLFAAIVFVASQYRHGLRWASWLSEITAFHFTRLTPLASGLDWNFTLLIPTLVALALLFGLVVYLLSEKSQTQ
jgi:hypothetical protein